MVTRIVAAVLVLFAPLAANADADNQHSSRPRLEEASVAQLQAAMAAGRLTSEQLTRAYIRRILAFDQDGPGVNSVMEINPDALAMARRADELRRRGQGARSPARHSGASQGQHRHRRSHANYCRIIRSQGRAGAARFHGGRQVARRRRGDPRQNQSFRVGQLSFLQFGQRLVRRRRTDEQSLRSQSQSLRVELRIRRRGSANFAAVSLGTETDGSIVCPGNANGVVGIKPTVGLTSRAGVVPISHTQDTVGPHGRTVAERQLPCRSFRAAPPMGAIPPPPVCRSAGQDARRPTNIPADYTQFLDRNGLQGARLGLTRSGIENAPAQIGAAFDEVLEALEAAGATVIDLDAAGFVFAPADGEFLVLVYEFRIDVANYFATRVRVPLAGGTLADAIAFNEANAAREMPFFAQEIFELANSLAPGPDDPQPAFGNMTYNQALEIDRLSGVNGMDKALQDFDLDAVIAPTDNPPWATDLLYGDHFLFGSSGLAAGAGYPIVQVPATNVHGAPLGISFFGTAFSEPTLIKLASGFEAVTRERAKNPPTFAPMLPDDHVDGTDVRKPRTASKPKNALPQDAKKWRPRRM